MIDIVAIPEDGSDMRVFNSQNFRAANILSVQIGALEYAPDLGIDLRYFLREDLTFQNQSFKAYLVSTIASYGINVAGVMDVIGNVQKNLTVDISPDQSDTGLIR